MRDRILLIVLLVLCVSAPSCLLEDPPSNPSVTCQEDEPCWDWRTMGNRCGRDSLDEPVVCH